MAIHVLRITFRQLQNSSQRLPGSQLSGQIAADKAVAGILLQRDGQLLPGFVQAALKHQRSSVDRTSINIRLLTVQFKIQRVVLVVVLPVRTLKIIICQIEDVIVIRTQLYQLPQ
ncbi:hypothetical protein D3C75_1040740 [compost metagenome]